jgi:nicotinate-nucleotide adenylyltransferase
VKKVFFGGSFDPPHTGHLGVARAALASGKCDEVVWFPAATPPHKKNTGRAAFAHRMNMIRLLIAGEKNMSVSDFEEHSGLSPSYTIDVLDKLEADTGERFILLIGGDSLLSLHTWHRAKELVQKNEFIVYPRTGSEVTMEKLLEFWDEKSAAKLYSSMLEGTFFEISSTELKNSMEKNSLRYHIIERENFPPEIYGYIRQHNLYE